MQILAGIPEAAAIEQPVALTIGNFDGVHLGHVALLVAVRDAASELGGVAAALTFDPHPQAVLTGRAPAAIMTARQRREALAAKKLGFLIEQPFDTAFSQLDAEDFLHRIADHMPLRCLVLGHDFRFGRGGRGDHALATELGAELGFEVRRIAAEQVGGLPVSSSRIRQHLQRGEVREAAELLGHPWEILGSAVPGAGRGRTLGWPTINLQSDNELIAPDGVYGGRLRLADGRCFVAAISIGTNPTFGQEPRHAEAFLLDYDDGLVEGDLRLELLDYLRGQIAFDEAAHLIAQIEADVGLIRETARREAWLT